VKRTSIATLLLLATVSPAAAKTHKDVYNVPCSTLWPAVKDVLRNSGKYGIIGIDSTEMTASYNIGGSLGGKRINSLVLNVQGNNCELQVQTAFSGLAHDDYGDLKKRVDASLGKMQPPQPAPGQPAPAAQTAPTAPAQETTPAQPAPAPRPATAAESTTPPQTAPL